MSGDGEAFITSSEYKRVGDILRNGRLWIGAFFLAACIVVGIVVTADNAINYDRVPGTVLYVERVCDFVPKEGRNAVDIVTEKDVTHADCTKSREFAALLEKGEVPYRKLKGTATVRVSFVWPGDHAPHEATYTVDGKYSDFYQLRAGTQVFVRVHKQDPSRIRPAYGG